MYAPQLILFLLLLRLHTHAQIDDEYVTANRERSQGARYASLPVYQLHYAVYYNSSAAAEDSSATPVQTSTVVPDAGEQKASNACARHYAETFLIRLFSLESWLNELCATDEHRTTSSRQPFTPRVNIHTVVVVRVYGPLVKVETDVNVTSRGSDDVTLDGGRDAMESCASRLNASLQQVQLLDEVLADRKSDGDDDGSTVRPLTVIDATRDCPAARMTPAGFLYLTSGWQCPRDLVLDRQLWRCVSHASNVSVTLSTVTQHVSTSQPSDVTDSSLTSSSSSSSSSLSSLSSPAATQQATVSPSPTSKYWGVATQRDIRRIYVTEGDRPYDLPLRVWYNRSALCGVSDKQCNISLEFEFSDDRVPSNPICRRTEAAMPQVVLARPSWSSSENSFCSVGLNTSLELGHDDVSAVTGAVYIKAVMDHKYDGIQLRDLTVSMVRRRRANDDDDAVDTLREAVLHLPVAIEDQDRKSTCQSVNDPHVTTFDGLEYNNYYEGEFILYRHKTLPFAVNAVYQRCERDVLATCNCGVMIRSGDDVLVIDRCVRRRHSMPPPLSGFSDDYAPVMSVVLYLNGKLTRGTRIHQLANGHKYIVYLPHGAYVKVSASGQLLNVWIVPSPTDLYMTEGLCGIYDGSESNDLHWRNGSVIYLRRRRRSVTRPQPTQFIRHWSVKLGSAESLMRGVEPSARQYEPVTYCECERISAQPRCGISLDVNYCDLRQGTDVTESLVARAVRTRRRFRRDVHDNSVSTFDDPRRILVNDEAVPPSKFKWKNEWNEVNANKFCRDFVKDKYSIGQLCAQISSVNFDQDIRTCFEDIQITGNTSWAQSARDAMKEQCREEAQKNITLPRHLVDQVVNGMCINDCSQHGQCVNGTCECYAGYESADCSVHGKVTPETSAAWQYGLCDIRTMNCSHVIVYGNNFVNSPNLTCHFQETKVTESTYVPLATTVTRKADFINFNAVECAVPVIRSYLISISNNGVNHSRPLLFIPFDSACSTCNIFNTSCTKIRNSCIIDGICYREGETSPSDHCLVCKAIDDEYQWTTMPADHCQVPWWDSKHLPDWLVAVAAAIVGCLVGVAVGCLIYNFCCRRKTVSDCSEDECECSDDDDDDDVPGRHCTAAPSLSSQDTSLLHRHRGGVGLPTAFDGLAADLRDLPADRVHHRAERRDSSTSPTSQRTFYQPFIYADGAQGVDNGLDSTTYF